MFGKFTGKSAWSLQQPLALKNNLLTGLFLWIFKTFFRTATFIFQAVTSVKSKEEMCERNMKFLIIWKINWHFDRYEKQYNIWGFCMLARVTLQNEFYNIFAYTAVKVSRWSLVSGVTIRPLIIESLIARRNWILVQSLPRKSNFRVSGSFFWKL